ncbi:MAG TPA: Crp/Fnr family transcriptional regulator [Flavitalea sp.]|nr:Crp/Fnr family transcriptional regulator [Flavitalea sp.]
MKHNLTDSQVTETSSSSLRTSHHCDLSSCFLCRFSLPEWAAVIEANRVELKFRKGQVIFEEGSEVKGMYFVTSGLVKVHKHWGASKELIIRFATGGEVFGHRGFGNERIFPITATALAPTTVCHVDLTFFESSLKVNTQLAFQFMVFLANELQESEKNMRDLVHMPVKGRIALTLLKLLEKFGTDKNGFINVSLARQDVASYAGTTYETVFRVVSSLEEEQLISTQGKLFKVLDPVGLNEYTRIPKEE